MRLTNEVLLAPVSPLAGKDMTLRRDGVRVRHGRHSGRGIRKRILALLCGGLGRNDPAETGSWLVV